MCRVIAEHPPAAVYEHEYRQFGADTLRADGLTRATLWVTAGDDAMRGFLTGAGWAPDGAHRELDLTGDGSTRVKQVRLHTGISSA